MTTDPALTGRTLPRPGDDIVDQGLSFDLGTLRRRQVLGLLGLGAVGGALAACGSGGAASPGAASSTGASSAAATVGSVTASATAASLVEIPDETAGPYPGDGSNGKDVLEQSGVIRRDIRSSFGSATATAEGIPLTLTLTCLDIARGGNPLVGAAVYVWHCDRAGNYSMYSAGVTGENYLRGVQITDASGVVSFTTIFPGCYAGRWPHIHFEVYPDSASITDSTKAIATSQVALPQATCAAVYATAGYESSVRNLAGVSLTSDNVFGDDGGIHQLGTVSGGPSGYAVSLVVPIDTRTAPKAGPMGR